MKKTKPWTNLSKLSNSSIEICGISFPGKPHKKAMNAAQSMGKVYILKDLIKKF
jgi:hypothetical protein